MIVARAPWEQGLLTWPQVWLDPSGQSPVAVVQSAANLVRQVWTLPLPLAISCCEEIRARVRAGTYDPQKSSLAVINDRYVIWEDRQGNLDALTQQRNLEIRMLPGKVVRYNPAGFYGALHAPDANADAESDHSTPDGSGPVDAGPGVR